MLKVVSVQLYLDLNPRLLLLSVWIFFSLCIISYWKNIASHIFLLILIYFWSICMFFSAFSSSLYFLQADSTQSWTSLLLRVSCQAATLKSTSNIVIWVQTFTFRRLRLFVVENTCDHGILHLFNHLIQNWICSFREYFLVSCQIIDFLSIRSSDLHNTEWKTVQPFIWKPSRQLNLRNNSPVHL